MVGSASTCQAQGSPCMTALPTNELSAVSVSSSPPGASEIYESGSGDMVA